MKKQTKGKPKKTHSAKKKSSRFKELLPRFETIEAAYEQSLIRQRCLEKRNGAASHRLFTKLSECNEDEPCCSGACPVCYRKHRKQLIKMVMRLCKKARPDWRVVTLIYYAEAMTDKEFLTWNVERLKHRLRKQLERAGINGPIIGSFDIDYHEDLKLWMPHFHLLIPFHPGPFEKLRQTVSTKESLHIRKGVKDRPMHVADLEDPPEQISYLFKSYWSRVYPYTSEGKRRTKKARLHSKQLALSLRKQDHFGYAGVLFLYGVRRYGNHLETTVSTRKKTN